MKTSTVLKKAIRMLDKGWCKGWFAHDKNGNDVDPENRAAVCWCMAGAIQKAMPADPSDVKRFVIGFVNEHLPKGYSQVSKFNDEPTTRKASVMKVMRASLADALALGD